MEHTPGPWEARLLIPDKRGFIKRTGTYEILSPEWDVATWIEHGGPIRREADAILIAESPNLLARLEQLVAAVDAYDGWRVDWAELRRAMNRGKAAIRQAKGE